MTDSRTKLDEVLDGIITAGVWILAFTLPFQIYPPQGDVLWGTPLLAIPLAVVFFVYIYRSARKAASGKRFEKGDSMAKALVPAAIFLVFSLLAL